jgi:psp operon transcriptional activator
MAPVTEVVFDPFASPFRPRSQTPVPPISPTTADESVDTADRPHDFRAAVSAFGQRLLESALQANRYNQRATARHLGLSYDQLRNQLRKHALN